MKYLMVLAISLSSHIAFASYHGGDSATGGDYDDDSYGSGSSAAYALVGVGVLYYFFRNKGEDNNSEFRSNFSKSEGSTKIVVDFEKSAAFSGNENLYHDPLLEKEFQINLKFKFN